MLATSLTGERRDVQDMRAGQSTMKTTQYKGTDLMYMKRGKGALSSGYTAPSPRTKHPAFNHTSSPPHLANLILDILQVMYDTPHSLLVSRVTFVGCRSVRHFIRSEIQNRSNGALRVCYLWFRGLALSCQRPTYSHRLCGTHFDEPRYIHYRWRIVRLR